MEQDKVLEKPLPSSPEAERIILGGILLDNALMEQAAELSLKASHFYSPLHRHIYKAMSSLFEKGEKIDPILISEEMKKRTSVEGIGGIATITNLTYGLPHFSSINTYVKLVIKKEKARRLLRKCNKIVEDVWLEEREFDEVLEEAEASIFEISSNESQEESTTDDSNSLVTKSIQRTQELAHSDSALIGITSGFPDIDSRTLGWKRQNLIILGARPSMGKTGLALGFSANASIRADTPVLYFSLEMSKEEMADRLICSEADVDLQKYQSGSLSHSQWEKVLNASQTLNSSALMEIDDRQAISPSYIRYRARRFAKKVRPKDNFLIVVDYLQLMSSDRPSDSRYNEVSSISRDLKSIAKELKVPLIALSQLSRKPEERGSNGHRPIMSDLRESGTIEQDADMVAFLYREQVYKKPGDLDSDSAELIFAKNRNGPPGTEFLRFVGPSIRFEPVITGF